MKYLLWILIFICSASYGQSNVYPSVGDVKIFSYGNAWAEGLAIIRPTAWSGVRFCRNDPAGGNYAGNWAIGYNANTGDDFDITTQAPSGQYSGVFHISNVTMNVGIGTTSPVSKLEVDYNNPSSDYSLSLPGFAIKNTSATSNNLNGIQFADANGWAVAGIMSRAKSHSGHTGDISFFTRKNGAAPAPQMTIDENGYVGIGTTSPNQRLTVNGTIYGKEVKVDLSVPGPDYVFEKSYDLPSLDEVKSYIDENKHLPEVPSAKEMEKNGINLSEMNMLLLKKVEELTLYAIEQQKADADLRGLIKDLQTKIGELQLKIK